MFFLATILVATTGAAAAGERSAGSAAASETRLFADIAYLASDALKGRGTENEGSTLAAEFIRAEFRKAGLKSGVADGSYFQPFEVRLRSKIDPAETKLAFKGPDGKSIELQYGKDFQIFLNTPAGAVNAPIVFVGYGISAPELEYDDYAGVDVAGKVVIMLRKEPQQADTHSKFQGTETTKHAGLMEKLENAFQKKALAVLMVNDPFSTKPREGAKTEEAGDRLMSESWLGFQSSSRLPLAQVKQTVIDQLLKETPVGSLAKVEEEIDKDLKPRSQVLNGWTAVGNFSIKAETLKPVNVVGVIEGSGPHADETIVIGSHYDHLGFGERGSLTRGSKEIHNGADDNASGTCAMLELARRYGLRDKPPARRMVFMAYAAEERGLLGSRHYVGKEPLIPLEKTVAMFNFDMVGRLQNDALLLTGTGTAKEFDAICEKNNSETKLVLKKTPGGGRGDSDHYSFFSVGIPILFFFTGLHPDYHKPSDDFDKINIEGMRRICDYAEGIIDDVLALEKRPVFVKSPQSSDPHAGGDLPRNSRRVWLGTIPNYAEEGKGVVLDGVQDDSPAAKAGLKKGDIIVEMDGKPTQSVQAMTPILFGHKPGDEIAIVIEREGKKETLKVTLAARPER